MKHFDAKAYNDEAFKYVREAVEHDKVNRLRTTGAFARDERIENLLTEQNGSEYGIITRTAGFKDKKAVKYDGKTNIESTSLKTISQGVVAIGKAMGFTEKDFSSDLIGEDFMKAVAEEVGNYWNDENQEMLLSVLKGIFSMTGTDENKFVESHTFDASTTGLDASTLNKAVQKACGDMKGKFSVVIMHSAVATELENLNLLEYLKYTDSKGVERNLSLATWNGKLVIIDDGMPEEDGVYTSYVLGQGAIAYGNLDVRVPSEMFRNPSVNGGEDTLFTRERMYVAPFGISYKSTAPKCPDNSELATGTNWELAKAEDNTTIPAKLIPIAQIKSKLKSDLVGTFSLNQVTFVIKKHI